MRIHCFSKWMFLEHYVRKAPRLVRFNTSFVSAIGTQNMHSKVDCNESRQVSLTDIATENLVRKIHRSPVKIVLYITGGAVQSLTWLLTVPGASKTLLESSIPYGGKRSIFDLTNIEVDTCVCDSTSTILSNAAYKRAVCLSSESPVLGVAATCALATDYLKRVLKTPGRSRIEEDEIASKLLIFAIYSACYNTTSMTECSVPLNREIGEEIESEFFGHLRLAAQVEEKSIDALESLYNDQIKCVEFCGGITHIDAPRKGIYLPGSFNPLHTGHRNLLQSARQFANPDIANTTIFELSILNVDKGLISKETVIERIKQFTDANLPVLVTKNAMYIEKAKMLPGSIFVIGYDTMVRLINPKYYGHKDNMLKDLVSIKLLGCSFLVAGRIDKNKNFCALANLNMPYEIKILDLFQEINESVFRSDLSSTILRETKKKDIASLNSDSHIH